MSRPSRVARLLLLLLLSASGVASAADSAAAAFARLRTLVGAWQGTFPDGRVHRVDYRMSAADTVLVETWTLAPGRESLTMYHLDGGALLATHYCPQGTQPRLQWQAQADNVDEFEFAFRDGTGLADPSRAHQRAFWVRLSGDGFERGETYVENNADADELAHPARGEAIAYRRIDAPEAAP